MTLADYTAFRSKIDALQRDAAQAEGRLQELRKRLQDEFAVDEAGAAKLLAKLGKEEAAMVAELAQAERKFAQAYPQLFEEEPD